jgi:glucokinase
VTILAGDIGGTNTRLAIHDAGGAVRTARTLPNRDFAHLHSALAHFLGAADPPRIEAAAFAVAGPVLDGRVRMTNIGWSLDAAALSGALGGCPVRLLNDLEAAAYGVLHLPPDELRVLGAGEPAPPRGNVGVIGAGTGLGEALLTWCGAAPHAIASEGGHADFAPRDATEFALVEWLGRTDPHVSWEDVVSGPGIVSVYRFLRDSGRGNEPADLRARLDAAVEPAQVITRHALAGDVPICVRTLETFVRAYGAEAGNLALTGMTLGGVFVTGGIAPGVLTGRFGELFMRAFVDKGRYTALMQRIPVRVVLCERASLVGAHAVARAML